MKTNESESSETVANTKDEFLTNPIDFANSNFFCSIATNIQSTTTQTFKFFHHYPTNPCVNLFLISRCTKKKILKIISNFDNNKATGINCIFLKITKLAKEAIAECVCSIYNISFTI